MLARQRAALDDGSFDLEPFVVPPGLGPLPVELEDWAGQLLDESNAILVRVELAMHANRSGQRVVRALSGQADETAHFLDQRA